MGNEQAAPLQQEENAQNTPQTIQMVQPKVENPQQAPQRQYTHGILIAIRGQRCTGKSTLVNRMKGGRFVEEYNPTKYLQATEIPYQPEDLSTDILSVKVLDVVEKALVPEDIIEKSAYPDATTIDTYKRSDGIVILIDSRHRDTVEVAARIINEAPKEIPIIVFSNFQDLEEVSPVLPELLRPLLGRFTYIPGSLKSNLGLIELSKWLMIPYMYSKKRQYLDLYNKMSYDLENALKETYDNASNFISLALAKDHMPVPPVRPQAQPATQRKDKTKNRGLTRTSSDEQFVKYRLHQQQQIKQMEKAQRKKERRASRPASVNDDFFEDVESSTESDDEFAVNPKEDYYGDSSPNPLVQNVSPKGKVASPLASPRARQSKLVPKEQPEEELTRRDDYEVDTSTIPKEEDNYPKKLKPTVFDSPLTTPNEEEEENKEPISPTPSKRSKAAIRKQNRQSQPIQLHHNVSNEEDIDDFFASDNDDEIADIKIKKLPPIAGLEPPTPTSPSQQTKPSPKLHQAASASSILSPSSKTQNTQQKELPKRKTKKLRRH